MTSSRSIIEKTIDSAISEDTEGGDITSELLIPSNMAGRAVVIANEEGTIAGGDILRMVFLKIDPSLQTEVSVEDGKSVKPGDIVATVTGRIQSILKAERTAINFLGRLSGVATETAKYVAKMEGTPVVIKDTRKTTPGLRILEKYAVYAAGGQNHRPTMASGIIIKDNHIAPLKAKGISLKEAIAKAKDAKTGMRVEVEAATLEEVSEAIEGEADIIMLDNMSLEDIKKAVDLVPEGIEIEASGGITLENAREVAMSGVDVISVGAITHSVKSIDFSLQFGVAGSEAEAQAEAESDKEE